MENNENNPLRQFFRRPAVYLSLPSGGDAYTSDDVEWPEGGKELPVYPMTAIDEITTKTPDALFNGTAMVEIIKSCIPAIKNPWNLLSNDLDSVLISIKAAGGQETIDVESECTNEECKALGTYGINLQVLLRSIQKGDYDKPLQIGDLTVYFQPIQYSTMNDAALKQFDIQAKYKNMNEIENEQERNKTGQDALKEITSLTMEVLAKATAKIVTPDDTEVTDPKYILDFFNNCDTLSYEAIRDTNADLRAKSTIKPLTITCDACQTEYTQPFTLNASDFFV